MHISKKLIKWIIIGFVTLFVAYIIISFHRGSVTQDYWYCWDFIGTPHHFGRHAFLDHRCGDNELNSTPYRLVDVWGSQKSWHMHELCDMSNHGQCTDFSDSYTLK